MRLPLLAALAIVLLLSATPVPVRGPGAAPPSLPALALASHAPILINGDADFTAANGVTGGNGTPADPYRIEGWDITPVAAEGVELRNTTAYALLRNLAIHGSDPAFVDVFLWNATNVAVDQVNATGSAQGIYLYLASHVVVQRSNGSLNDGGGLTVGYSDHIRVDGNFGWSSSQGVTVRYSSEVAVTNNTVWDEEVGIEVIASQNVTVFGNRVTGGNPYYSGGAGILVSGSVDTVVSDNDVSGLQAGIRGGDATALNVTGNRVTATSYLALDLVNVTAGTIAHNDLGGHVMVDASRDVVLDQNTAYAPTTDLWFGVYITDSDGVILTRNNLTADLGGLTLGLTTNATLEGNLLGGYGLILDETSESAYASHTITPDNLVGGKPLRYYSGATGVVVDGLATGQLILVNCTSPVVSNLILPGSWAGVTVLYSRDLRLSAVSLAVTYDGIRLVNVTSADLSGVDAVGGDDYAIYVQGSANVTIQNSSIRNASSGVWFGWSQDVRLENSSFLEVQYPVVVWAADRAFLVGNSILTPFDGIEVYYGSGVTLSGNAIQAVASTGYYGVGVSYTTSSLAEGNYISNFSVGFSLESATGWQIFGNRFYNNTLQAADVSSTGAGNLWDGGYPTGGNEWSDYAGHDDCSGPNQDVCPNPDGIGDTPYTFPGNEDRYPLMPRTGIGWIDGIVVNAATGSSISGAYVLATGAGGNQTATTTDSQGIFNVTLLAGTYRVGVSAQGYVSASQTGIPVVAGIVTLVSQALNPTPNPIVLSLAVAAGQPGHALTFYGNITTPGSGTWRLDFGDGTNSGGVHASGTTAISQSHTYSAAGNYTVTLNATSYVMGAETTASAVVDGAPPVSVASVSGTEVIPGWYRGLATITLSATDDRSGVDLIRYSVDGGPWQLYTTSITFGSDGNYTLAWHAVDRAGNAEAVHTMSLGIDTTPPELVVIPPTGTTITSSRVTLEWLGKDLASGLAGYKVSEDNGPQVDVGMTSSFTAHLADGTHTITVWAFDNVGNNVSKSITVTIDTNPFSLSGPYAGAPTYAILVAAVVAAAAVVWWRRRKKAAPLLPPEGPKS